MKIFVKDFKEADRIITPLLVSNVNRGVTASGAPYLSLTLSDKSGSIEAKLWDVKEEQSVICRIGKVLLVDGDIYKYKNGNQLKVRSVKEAEEYAVEDFVSSSEVSENKLREEIYSTLDSIQNPVLSKVVTEVMKENEESFFKYPAASKNHHNYVGGLAEHTCGMLKMGKAMCEIYPLLNRDLLLSGIMIHDIGKIDELSGNIVTEYTTEGRLIGHISIMHAKLFEIADRLGVADTEEVLLLRHMVLAHHGAYEYGSPILPEIPEAEALTFIDNVDAKMNMLKKAMADTKEGEFTGRIFALENRSFYKSKLKK